MQIKIFRAATLLLALASGCSKPPFELAPVSGQVTIDGQPFTAGKVMFAPVAQGSDRLAGRAAFGRVDANGEFSLSTYEPGDGAVIGDHWVTIIRLDPESPDGAPIKSTPAGFAKFDRLAVPQKVTVAANQDNRIDVHVTRQEAAAYGMASD